MGNRSRRERRIGAATALEWAASATLRRDKVSSAVTAKPAAVTRAVIAMTTATVVTDAGAVHRVVHGHGRRSPARSCKHGAEATGGTEDRENRRDVRHGDHDRRQRRRQACETRCRGRRAQQGASVAPGSRSGAGRSAREDDGAAATPSVGNEAGRAAVPLRGWRRAMLARRVTVSPGGRELARWGPCWETAAAKLLDDGGLAFLAWKREHGWNPSRSISQGKDKVLKFLRLRPDIAAKVAATDW